MEETSQAIGGEELGHAKVRELRDEIMSDLRGHQKEAGRSYQDVERLDIPVQDRNGVEVSHSADHMPSHSQAKADRNTDLGRSMEDGKEGSAGGKLHDNGESLVGDAKPINLNNIGA